MELPDQRSEPRGLAKPVQHADFSSSVPKLQRALLVMRKEAAWVGDWTWE